MKIDYHRITGTNTGVFAFTDEKFKERKEEAEIFADSSNCKIGDVRVVNLNNFELYKFRTEGSNYNIEKNGDLIITKQLNRDLDVTKYGAWEKTMKHWMDHFVFNLSNVDDNKDKKNEYYFSQMYKNFYCIDEKYKQKEICKYGKVLSNVDLKTYGYKHAQELFYHIKIPDSGKRAPSMQFSMLFGPPYNHDSKFVDTPSTISFYWPLHTKILIGALILIFVAGGVLAIIFIKRYMNKEIEKGINKAERMKLLSDDRPQEAFEHIMSCMPDPQKKILKKIYIDPRYNQRLIKVTNQ